MSVITICTVGDLYRLIKDCEEFQAEVDKAEKEYEDCNYDPCGYRRGNVLDAEELRDVFFSQPVEVIKD